jgi:DNA-binding PadR family transcriptional regulator
MSGYDIKRVLKELGWLVGTPSFGSLYPALHALLKNGLVTVEVVSRQDKPSRKIYTITQAGQRALQEWASQPVGPNLSLKSFVMRLMLADNFTQEELLTQLRQRRDQILAHHTALAQTSSLPDEPSSLGQCLTSDYSLALADAELTWLDSTLNRLSQEPSPAEAEQTQMMDRK